MRAAWLGLAFGYAAAATAANDAGPLRDLNWGLVPADNGIAYVPFDIGGSLDDRATVAALQPDDKLLLGGWATTGTGTDVALARILSSHGVLDPGFGSGGRQRLGSSTNGGVSDLAIMADGRIVYATPLSTTTFAIGRLLADGTPDTTFDFDGRRALAASAFVPLASILSTPKIVVQPDGKVVVFAGAGRTTPDIQVYAVATRLNTDGSTDTTFGGQGTGYGSYAPAYGSTPVAEATAVVRLATGQFIAGGLAYHTGGSGLDMITFRLSANGVLDTSYGANGFGFVAFDQGGSLDDVLTGVAIDSAGRAVVTGNISDINDRPRSAIARLTASGQIDATFGTGGRVLYEVRAAAVWEYSNSVAVLRDGRILVAGTSALCACGDQFDAGTLTMFASNGQINRFFGVNGTERFGSEFGPDAQNLPVAQMFVSGDYAYVTGWAHNPVGTSNTDFASARVVVPLFRSGFEAAEPAP
ncbi:MAG: hypothetical protein ABIQ78_12105 [Dokdonella sp.]